MTQNEWSFLGSSAETNTLQPTLTFFRSVAQRNHARSRLRFLRARSLSPHLNLDVWDDEAHYVDPSGDESLPLERPEDPLNFPEYFFLSSPDPRLTVQSLKRRGDPLDWQSNLSSLDPRWTGSNKDKRTERDTGDAASDVEPVNPYVDTKWEGRMADFGLSATGEDHLRPALVPEDRQNAINFPNAGWPSYRTLYGADPPDPLTHADLRAAPLFPLDPKTNNIRESGTDIAPRALAAASAEKVAQEQWVMSNDSGQRCSPLVGLDFVVYRLRDRVTRRHPNHNGPWGVRLGPNANGALAQKFIDPEKMPPGARKASPREIIQFLQNPRRPRGTRTPA